MRPAATFLVGLSAGFAAHALAGPPMAAAATLEKIRLTQPVEALSHLGLYVARANKYFEGEGIELEVTVTGGDGPDVQALLAKDVEFSASNPRHLYTAYLEGKPLVGVASLTNRCVINFVIHKEVARERGLTEGTPLMEKLKALKGLTIGATRAGALTYYLAIYFVKKAGYEPQRDVKIIGAGSGPALIAALENRKVDVIDTATPTPEQAVARGFGMMLIHNSAGEDPDLGEFLQTVLVVRPETAREHPETVRRMVRAIVRANAWIAQQPPEAIGRAIAPFFARMNPELLTAAVRSVKHAVPADGRITEKATDAFQDVYLVSGALKRKVPFQAVYSNDFLSVAGGR